MSSKPIKLKKGSLISDHFPALGFRDFRIFWIGQFISLIGTWMQTTIQPYLAYQLTSQPIYLGLIGFASSLPALILMLPSGVYIERLDKRKVVIAMQAVMMIQALVLAYLTLTGIVTIWDIIGLAFVLGIANAIEITARQAMIIELVDRQALPNAIALNSTIFNLARVIGPSFSTPFMLLVHNNGEGWGFFANGISYLFVIGGLFLMKSKSLLDMNAFKPKLLEDFKDGQKYIRSSSNLAWLIIMVTVPAFFGFPFSQQMPVFASNVLSKIGDTDAIIAARNSLLITAQGFGALIAALSLALFSNLKNKGLILTIGQVVFAVALIGFSQAHSVWLAMILLVFIGWGTVTHLAMTNTLVQLSINNEFRGRVMSTYFWAQSGVAPFGSLFIGWLAQNWGAPFAVLVGGGICLIAYVFIHLLRPKIKQIVM
jgi:MFS family permease